MDDEHPHVRRVRAMSRRPGIAPALLLALALALAGCAHAPSPGAGTTPATEAAVADAPARLPLTRSTEIVVADVPQGIALLSEHDDYLGTMTPLDRRIRLGGREPSDEAALVARIAGEVRALTPGEVEIVRDVVAQIARELLALGLDLPLPSVIGLVKTTGREEVDPPFGLAYTRGTTIVLDEAAFRDAEELLPHELFHVLTRNAPALRDALYEVIGYHRVPEIELPSELEHRRLTNPDSPFPEHVIRVRAEGADVDVFNLLVARGPYRGGHLFEYLVPVLVALDDQCRVVVDANGNARLFEIEEVDGYYDQIGRNTSYVMQPEEVLADDFVLVLRGERRVPTPRVLDAMLDVLRHATPE